MEFPRLVIALIAGVVIALAAGGYYWLRPFHTDATTATYPAGWDADMEDLWRPLVETKRPLILAIEDPLFAELNGSTETYFRDRTLNNWNQIAASPTVAALRTLLKSSAIQPSRHFTSFGEVDASFMIAKLLGPREQSLSVVRTSDFPLRLLADNNVLFVGVETSSSTSRPRPCLSRSSSSRSLRASAELHPRPRRTSALRRQDTSTAPSEEGGAYALVTHLPGPLRDSDVESFTSSRSAGYVGAVKLYRPGLRTLSCRPPAATGRRSNAPLLPGAAAGSGSKKRCRPRSPTCWHAELH